MSMIKLGLGGELLTSCYFAQADVYGLVVKLGLFIHSPAQVNGLETRSIALAKLLQVWEDLFLEYFPFGPHVAKGRNLQKP